MARRFRRFKSFIEFRLEYWKNFLLFETALAIAAVFLTFLFGGWIFGLIALVLSGLAILLDSLWFRYFKKRWERNKAREEASKAARLAYEERVKKEHAKQLAKKKAELFEAQKRIREMEEQLKKQDDEV